MALATYTSDLTDIYLFETTGGISAYGGGAAGLGASPDYAIEGTNAVDKQVSAAEKGFMYDNGANFTIGANDHFFIWMIVGVPGLADTRDNRGIHVSMGDGTSNFVKFHANGTDTLPTGGLVPYPIRFVNTTLANRRTLVGAPGTTPSWIGGGANITGTAKFSNFACDAARIGTGYDILNGTGADPEANFAGISSDDTGTAEGIFQPTGGGYNLQGKLRLGSSTVACEFKDENTNINLVDTIHSLTDFTEILLEHASSILTLTNINFNALGTNNRGRFEMITSAATATLNNVGFIGFGVTILGTGATLLGCRWVGSDIVTANGADLTGSSFSGYEGTANTSELIWDVATNPDGKIDSMSFTMGTAATHAIEFGTNVPASMTIRDCDFSGYSASNNVNDSTFHFKDTTGTITLNIVGGSGNVSYRTDGATIVIVQDPVTTSVHAQTVDQVDVADARVLLKASDGTGPLPFEDIVTITQTAGTATVSHTGHGFATNHYVVIKGAVPEGYNKVAAVTVIDANSYTYAVDSGLTSPATGTILATGAIVYGLTDVNGDISDSRTLATDQPVVGWCRKSTTAPFYKSAPLGGVVSSTLGGAFTSIMILDQ